jgi:hypothetical protein
VSIARGSKPASDRRSRNGHSRSFQNGAGRFLLLPTHGSTSTQRRAPAITNACTRMVILPAESAKSGTSHSWRAISAVVAAGNRNWGGMCSVSSSTTLVMVSSPTFQR